MKQRKLKRIKNKHSLYSVYKDIVSEKIGVVKFFNTNENLLTLTIPVVINNTEFRFKYSKQQLNNNLQKRIF